LGSVLLINANSLSASPGVAIMSLIKVLQNTTLPAPIIAILGFVIVTPPDYHQAQTLDLSCRLAVV
jgi:hypothetical protein